MRNACVLLLPDATNDRGFAMTSSFSAMLLAAALAFGALDAGRRPAARAAAASRSCRVSHALGAALAARRFERVVVLGSNGLRGLAAEAALKLLELTDGRTVAVAESALGFRHGPKTIINDRTLVVVLPSNDAYTRAYDRDLLAELRRDGRAGAIVALAARPADLDGVERIELFAGMDDAPRSRDRAAGRHVRAGASRCGTRSRSASRPIARTRRASSIASCRA